MDRLGRDEWIETLNTLGGQKAPFLFCISFDKQYAIVERLERFTSGVRYKIRSMRNYSPKKPLKALRFAKSPISFERYCQDLAYVQEEIRSGNTYLLNLTFQTPIDTNYTLEDIFFGAKAKFKLLIPEHFVCFSPEPFVDINNDYIYTYPMKGTIDAQVPDAKAKILSDIKEIAEHVMIVDLMRNDLGMVGKEVRVEKFRYVEKIRAGSKELLQVSSKIRAKLDRSWRAQIGTLFDMLLPAGSISGTPKKKTVEIIEQVEGYDRGFYTGVFGVFDGTSLQSAVMIRFIEKSAEGFVYKSGGGITIDSDPFKEYQELIDKVYIPL